MATKEIDFNSLLLGLGERLSQSLPNLSRYKPHPKQEAFHKAAADKRGRLYIGGNRAGKTIANVTECLWWLTKTHPYKEMPAEPVRGRLTCVSFLDGLDKIILPLFKQWLPEKYLVNGKWEDSYDKEHKTLTLNNGSFVEFMSYDQDLDKFAGTSRHFVAFDEEPPQNIWNECRARLVDTGGSWWISMTPVDGMTWIYDTIYEENVDNPQGKYKVVQADMLDNPHISPEEAEEFLSGLDERERRAREKGEFVQLGGRVFKTYDPEKHRAPYLYYNQDRDFVETATTDAVNTQKSWEGPHFKLTPDMRIYTSIDIGWAHPTAWLWHAVEPSGHITTFYEMVEPFVNIEDWAKRVHAFEKANGIQVYLRTGDPALMQTRATIGVNDIMEFGRHGIHLAVEGVPRQVDIGLRKIDQYLKEDTDPREGGRPFWQHTANCIVLERQMKRLRWATYASKKLEDANAPKGTIHKKDDDAPDSLRYFMTLQPDLSFEQLNGKVRKVSPNPLDIGPKDYAYNLEYEEPESIYEVSSSESAWALEN